MSSPNDVLGNDSRTETETVLPMAGWALRVAEHVTDDTSEEGTALNDLRWTLGCLETHGFVSHFVPREGMLMGAACETP